MAAKLRHLVSPLWPCKGELLRLGIAGHAQSDHGSYVYLWTFPCHFMPHHAIQSEAELEET